MFADRIEGKWIDAFAEVFERCAVRAGVAKHSSSDTTAVARQPSRGRISAF